MVNFRKITTLLITLSIAVIPVLKGAGATEKMEHQERVVLDFSRAEDRESWYIINDGVMGGISRSEIIFSESGTAVFQGTVSLEHNGGFASTRSGPRSYKIGEYSGLLLQIRGDGKDYQLRLRTDSRFDGISYRYRFTTQPETVQTIRAEFTDFEPVFRGRVMDGAEPLSPENIQQLGFLIADKQSGTFRIEVDWIKAFK
jgi:hypothetical protein